MNSTINISTEIPGYHLIQELYSGSRNVVYRGIRKKDQQPVVIKIFKKDYPSLNELLQFRSQYTIAKTLQLPGVIKPYSLESYGNSYALIMEDFGGISLKDYGKTHTLKLNEFLEIALQITSILHGLHQYHVIHKDIKPANILIHPTTQQVKLIDFSIASLLPKEIQEIKNPNILEGSLAYISPEQTGRMNRGIDYRTDFYSLGVTFYELLIGELPFQSNDLMELIHCHIAKPVTLVHEICPQIPLVLSEIVSKLMAKNAEDRYQSALGLKFDLENCLHQLQETGVIRSFEIGQRDLCDRFMIPEKLYGRQTEVETLLQAFERVSQGATEMMLVAGFSGIGKTAVVNEVHKPIVRQRGYFIKGKFDQFNRNIPLSAFVQVFRDLMGQLLTESDAQIQQWKNQILAVLGENGQVIIEVIPELERIIGQQPAVLELSGTAAQNRFNLLFQKFTQVFTSAEHPLVMFLDDLQWADSASLKLIQLLMADTRHLFFIGAYRDNEVNPGHPLMLTLREIQETKATINRITLTPLSQFQINQLVADTLKSSESLALPLSQLVFQKTQGNPFFATQFLKALHQENLIQFDIKLGCWQFDMTEVMTQAVTDDVVEFMTLQLEKLPLATQNILKLAACIGNQFDLATLAMVSEQSVIETAATLWKVLQEGLILPMGDVYKFYVGQETLINISKNQENVTYKFIHDRVQQAAYSLIPDDQKQEKHYQIGQLLLHHIPPEKQGENIFEIVNHLNRGRELITTPKQRNQLAELNLRAGEKALAATAYVAAARYFDSGVKSLDVDSWQSQYRLTLSLYESAIKAEYLNINFSEAQTLANFVLERTNNVLDRVKLYELQIQMYMAQSEMPKALAVGMLALELLGVDLTNTPKSSAIYLPKLSAIDSWPVMRDAHQIAVMRILMAIFSPAYTTRPELLSPIVLTMIDLSLREGHTSLSAFAYVFYGILLCGFEKDLEKGYYSGLLALKVLDRFAARDLECKVNNLFNVFIRPWKEPLIESLKPLESASQIGFEMGDIEYASYATAHCCTYRFLAGETLTEVKEQQTIALEVLRTIQQDHSLGNAQIWQQLVSNLLGEVTDPSKLSGEHFDETERLPIFCAGNDRSLPFTAYLAQCMLSYLLGDDSAALTSAVNAANYADAAIGITVAIHNFYYSLTLLSYCTHWSASEDTQPSAINNRYQSLLEQVEINQKFMKAWAVHAPTNFEHKYSLVEAEKCRVLGQRIQAGEQYDRAIILAKENGYIQEEALANELAAKFYLDWDKQRIAEEYITNAYYAYACWGARAKVADLENRYPQLLAPILQQTPSPLSTHETISNVGTLTSVSSRTSSSSVSAVLDLATIFKASQAISGEIELEKLLSSLLSIVIENAGADKCVLMLLRDDLRHDTKGKRLLIKGLMTQGTEPVVLQRIPVEESQDIPLKLIYKVKHNRQIIVLLDATADPTLANDPYILRQQPKSILCSPILHQGKFMGILYLENNLATGAFTNERVELLNLLCAQAAISIENATLYERSQNYAQQLEKALHNLQNAQLQLVQSEKMSALGNLVAGVAHEMNNPLGFISATLQQAKPTFIDIVEHLKLYQETFPNKSEEIIDHAEEIDLEYSLEDLPKAIDSMGMACDRLKNISTSLRTFSRADKDYKVRFNIHEGIESTILILKHRLKANDQRPAIEVVTNYGDLPEIECFPGQLNQVFMNIFANAIDALEESNNGRTYAEIKANLNRIIVTTSVQNFQVKIVITDNGIGMSESVKEKIFDHLFTTKTVGKGTGLGLAIARQIIVEKHQGSIKVYSQPAEGTEFIITLPIQN